MAALRSAEGARRKQRPQVGHRYLMSLLCCQVREGLIQRGVPLEKRLFCEKAGGVPDTSQGSIAGREKVCDLLCLQKPPGNAVCSLIWKGMTFLQNT